MKKTDEIFSKLGLSTENGLFLTDEQYWKKETSFPNRVKRLIERKIKPAAFFCFDNKPLILFFENHPNPQKLHEDIWNFNECPIAIIIQNDVVEIYNGFNFLKDKKTLEKLGGEEKLNDFTYFELVTGRTWEQYQERLNYKNRVDYHLLQNIKAARKLLLGQEEHKAKLVNAILGKVIFVRYLIDREVKMKFDDKLRTWSNEEFCKLLDNPIEVQRFFEYLDDKERGFNGDLFPLTPNEYQQITANDFQILKRLLQGEDIERNQPSLFEFYDFSIIPIEFISNIYELFIGQVNQKKEGAYYTPLFLVDYILKETVERKLNIESSDFTCKVLDPACGSGIFLVETLRKIIEKYIRETGVEIRTEKFKTAIKNLAKENIYGIDKDLSAVQVAIFSIYLTLLDYLEPPGIETFKFPILFNTNFFKADFFDEDSPFNNRLKNVDFDFILGNPPWSRGKGEEKKPAYVEYIDKRKRTDRKKDSPKIDIGNREIAQAFLLRSSDFSKKKTKSALVVTSKVLYNMQSALFRKYFLHYFFIERIFELAPVRREVFDKSNDKAIAPACILFFHYANGTNTDLNTVEHIALKPSRFFSLFKIFTINRTDFKTIQQNKLKEFDWLLKILVYGSYLDFNFIRRLYSDNDTIGGLINKERLLLKQGLKRKDGNKKISVRNLISKSFLNTQKGELKPFSIVDTGQKWEQETVGYIYQEHGKPYIELFQPYSLLITGGIFSDFTSNAAISKVERVFTSSVRALKIFNDNQLPFLYSINSILCSSLFSYYMLNIGASAGIEREESEDEEIKKMWFFHSSEVAERAKTIEIRLNEKDKSVFTPSNIPSIKGVIDPLIFKAFQITSEERILIDFATDVSIPIIMNHPGNDMLFKSLPIESPHLNSYANIFLNRFESILDTNDKKFVTEIWHTRQIVGMFFKMIPASEYTQNIVWVDKQEHDLATLSLLTKISSEKITEKLFVQKDIRGFEKDYFYIFKPNEKRLWHEAIGFLDVNDFADAILKAGRDRK